MRAINTKTNIDIYLEWVNDWLTTERMAEYYQTSKRKLEKIINQGRIDYLSENETPEYKKVWSIK